MGMYRIEVGGVGGFPGLRFHVQAVSAARAVVQVREWLAGAPNSVSLPTDGGLVEVILGGVIVSIDDVVSRPRS